MANCFATAMALKEVSGNLQCGKELPSISKSQLWNPNKYKVSGELNFR
jgi:hypothetical protein